MPPHSMNFYDTLRISTGDSLVNLWHCVWVSVIVSKKRRFRPHHTKKILENRFLIFERVERRDFRKF